ncbi:MAG: PKD domain-containing protein [Marinicella sp.]
MGGLPGKQAILTIGGDSTYESVTIFGSVEGQVSGNLVDCGDMSTSCPTALNNICLIEAIKSNQNTDQQGNFNINQQVLDCQSAGGIAAIFYSDVAGVQYSAYVDDNNITIPAVSISDAEMAIAYNQLGSQTDLNLFSSNYTRSFGTSISSPYVASAAALVWSYHPNCSADEIRQTLALTAKDLGVAGKDAAYGYGLPQANDAKLYLDATPCGGVNNMTPTATFITQCSLLTCDFDGSGSSDADGMIVDYSWNFGDGNQASVAVTNHSFTADGNYTVTLTVTDDDGATSNYATTVTVSNSPIQLTANGYKIKGKAYTDLMWNGATTATVDIYRNAVLIDTVNNSGLHTDFVGQRGQFDYQVCEAQTAVCSSIQSVSF